MVSRLYINYILHTIYYYILYTYAIDLTPVINNKKSMLFHSTLLLCAVSHRESLHLSYRAMMLFLRWQDSQGFFR